MNKSVQPSSIPDCGFNWIAIMPSHIDHFSSFSFQLRFNILFFRLCGCISAKCMVVLMLMLTLIPMTSNCFLKNLSFIA